ncbi:MAG: glutamate mutase L [Chloroflexota bacterium]
MPDSSKTGSLLVADIGSVTTKVGLVDSVNGEFRYVSAGIAATTATPPETDVLTGVRDAIRQIEARAERQLLTDDQQLIVPERSSAQGVDAFVAITSAPQPLRVAIVGLSRELSVASAVRAVNRTHAMVEATFALDETGGRWIPLTVPPSPDGGQTTATTVLQDPLVLAAETLARARPDVIVLVGGIDGGATTALYDLANLVAVIIGAREESARPIVIFAGNSAARAQIANRIAQLTPLHSVDNVRPTVEQENLAPLQHELETLYDEKKVKWLPGLNGLTNWTSVPVVPSSLAFQNVVRYLARRFGLSVLGADIGGGATTIVTARGDTTTRAMHASLGIGHHLRNLIEQVGVKQLMDWLPIELLPDEAQTGWLNQSLRPRALPATRQDAYLAQAAARVALATAAREVSTDGLDLVVLTGGAFTSNSNLGALALLALDALQPRGVFSLALDPFGLAPAFGGLAYVNPEAAASVIERDGFTTLGTVIAPLSNNREGQIDARVQITPPSGGVINLEVQHGSLELVPLLPGQKALIEVRPTGGVELPHAKRGIFKAEVAGGALGLIIDARGRPIGLPSDPEKRRTKVQEWYWDVGGEVAYG